MIKTSRLLLRSWREEDLAGLAAMNADPRVMEFFPSPLTREESVVFLGRLNAHIAAHGFGFWAVEEQGLFAGFIGLARPSFEAHFTPCVEIGWRLQTACWGRGLATEGARAALAYGFGELGLDEIVAYTVPANQRSRRVMEKIGMSRAERDDFDHPRMAEGHPLRRHVLYRINSRA